MTKHTLLPLLLLALPLLTTDPASAASVVDELLRDISAIDSGGNPASLLAFGEAQPLVVSPQGDIFAAASELGAGRVVALGHGGFVASERFDSPAFIANAVEWLAGDREPSAERPLRVWGLSDPVALKLEQRQRPIDRLRGHPGRLTLESVDVVIGSPQAFAKAGRLDDLEAWLRGGGGLLVTETAWGILQLNPDLRLETLAANQLLPQAGIRFTGEAHSGYGQERNYAVERALLEPANADRALDILAGERPGDAPFAAKIVGKAFQGVPLDSPLIKRAQRLAAERRAELNAIYANLARKRLTPEEHPLARALLDLDDRLAQELPAQEITAHPSSVAFPGPVGPDRVDRARLALDPTVPGWHSTGLYAPPGEVVTISVPAEASEAGLVVQIGAWCDPHTHAHRLRLKHARRRFPIDATETAVASAMGGPIYLDVPPDFAREWKHESIQVEIRGAAQAPHYRHGVTDLDDWRETIRRRQAPWAELESEHLVLTLPSSVVRQLDRPDLVMEHWDAVHRAMQSLEPRTSNHWGDRPYRFVADTSVSWGYMYCPANAPITIPLGPAGAMVDVANFDAQGPNHLWGHYHEMGHAHQSPLWTDGATGEVTVNIFTVYALHTVNGYPLDSEVMRSDHRHAWETFTAHRASGKPFEAVGGPFPRLQLFALLWHNFGFESFHEAFDKVRHLPADQRPRDDLEERNLMLVHFSEATGRNLAPYFEAWGIEVLEASRARVGHLPDWMPPRAEGCGRGPIPVSRCRRSKT